MGSGKNGTFDKKPDFFQWAIFCVHHQTPEEIIQKASISTQFGRFINSWIQLFTKEHFTIFMDPIAGHGKWDNKDLFGTIPSNNEYQGPIATLTRATIRLTKLKYFWENVAPVASKMSTAKGFIYSAGIGEVPWIKQATFSIWETASDMKAFAYGMKEHSEVIKKTKQQNWYSEDMFVRFKIISVTGHFNKTHPINIFK